MKSFPLYLQLDAMDCGPTCLRMIARHYGRSYTLQNLRERSFITREGVSMLGISDAAESIGMHTQGVRITLEQLMEDVPLPCILHWNQNHFVVLYHLSPRPLHRRGSFPPPFMRRLGSAFSPSLWRGAGGGQRFHIADPAGQKYVMNAEEFCRCWHSSKNQGKDTGIALLLEPTPDFYDFEDDQEKQQKNLGYFFRYLLPYKSQYAQIIVGMILGSILALIFPFITQAVVDQGIGNNNLNFIVLMLIAQLVLSVTQMGMGFIQNWITLHTNTRISISLISDFLYMDEATNSLDANNEKQILDNLSQFYQGKTVVIVAHRLSTVQNADTIIVLEKGKVIEEGTHKELTEKRGAYYMLVKNQLELGS
jgi:ATP-binding cassette subfamily B protein